MRALGANFVNKETSSSKRVYINVIFVVIFIAISFLLPMVFSHKAHAAGAIGDGGGAGGGSGGAQTRNGWGWYNFSVNGNPQPYGFRNGSSWGTVSNICKNVGSDRVLAFIVLRVSGYDASTGVVYDYKSSWDSLSNYRGNSGGNWIPTSSAKALYDSLDIDKTGFTWGSNVAWFCYSTSRYELIPTITGSPNSIETNSTIRLSPSVNNVGQTASSNTSWEVNRFILSPGVAVPNGGTSSSGASSYFGNGATIITSGSGTRNFARGLTSISVPDQQTSDYTAGTRICYALSVRPWSTGNNVWRHSNPFCVTVGKKPKVQIHGGDLYVGRGPNSQFATSNVTTSTTVKTISNSQRTFGSWVEYGIFATGNVTGAASGSAFAAPSGLANANSACIYSTLTWSNATVAGNNLSCSSSTVIGRYQHQFDWPNIDSKFAINSSTPQISASSTNLNGLQGVYTRSSSLTINTSSISAGRWVVINMPNADVTINGNINYSNGPFSNIANIPQVIIIARNINIAAGVTNIDAWLVANGSGSNGAINTCSSVATGASLTINDCNQRLTVNGPVMAKHLFLRRTAGSGSGNNTGDPAEVFNLRPDVYLWAANQALSSGKASTVYMVELPPRF